MSFASTFVHWNVGLENTYVSISDLEQTLDWDVSCAGRALLILEILMVDEDTTLSMLSHISHPGLFVVNLAHLITQTKNQPADYATPEAGPTVIRDTSRKLLRMLLATPPLLR